MRCKEELGYPAFKIHGWIDVPIEREVAAVLRHPRGPSATIWTSCSIRLAPTTRSTTCCAWAGRADEARYFWYEDAFRGGGFSSFAHTKLRQFIKTPLLLGEHVRGLEQKADTIHSGAADYVRAGGR